MKRIKQSDRDGALRNSLSSSSKSEFSSLGFAKNPVGTMRKSSNFLVFFCWSRGFHIIGIGLRDEVFQCEDFYP